MKNFDAVDESRTVSGGETEEKISTAVGDTDAVAHHRSVLRSSGGIDIEVSQSRSAVDRDVEEPSSDDIDPEVREVQAHRVRRSGSETGQAVGEGIA